MLFLPSSSEQVLSSTLLIYFSFCGVPVFASSLLPKSVGLLKQKVYFAIWRKPCLFPMFSRRRNCFFSSFPSSIHVLEKSSQVSTRKTYYQSCYRAIAPFIFTTSNLFPPKPSRTQIVFRPRCPSFLEPLVGRKRRKC